MGGRRAGSVALAVVGGMLAAAALGAAGAAGSAAEPTSRDVRTAGATTSVRGTDPPNIVVITSDDQALSDLRWMPRTKRVLGDAGLTFTSMLSPHPLCCPARGNLLTGQYAQNSGVRSNETAMMGGFRALDPAHTLPVWLQDAGYRTAFVGKYLNGYEVHLRQIGDEPDGRQPGWNRWNPIIAHLNQYFGATFYDNGHRKSYERHSSDVIKGFTERYIRRFAEGPEPFFLWASHFAPHASCAGVRSPSCWEPAVPAPRHRGLFRGVRSPSFDDPAYNERDMSDKPDFLQRSPIRDRRVQRHFLGRIRSLQAVDEAVADAVATLRDVGELDNTLVVFASDNGILSGEHRVMTKNLPYEQALRVPLLLRGPGVPRDEVRRQTVTMIDLAPTFLELAGVTADVVVDGRSLLPAVGDPEASGSGTVLIQAGPTTEAERDGWGWSWRGVRTGRYTYVRHASGFEELYDRRRDPAQLRSVVRSAAYAAVRAELRMRTEVLGDCAGDPCRQEWGPVPPPAAARR